MIMISEKEVSDYLIENYGECRHNANKMARGINMVAFESGIDAWDVFRLIIENKPIKGKYTHSYGFCTANGRNLINTFKTNYYGQNETN
jgi:hypothetical protein